MFKDRNMSTIGRSDRRGGGYENLLHFLPFFNYLLFSLIRAFYVSEYIAMIKCIFILQVLTLVISLIKLMLNVNCVRI